MPSSDLRLSTHLISGFVLVGGQSSRFGSDKALFQVGEQPMALRVAAILKQVVEPVTLVGSPGKYELLGLPVIADAFDKIGPMGGIVAALEASSTDWNLIVACDLAALDVSVVEKIASAALESEADVIWPRTPDGRLQPLCAAYRTQTSARVRANVEAGIRAVRDAFRGCVIREIEFDDPASFTNINHMNDLK